MYGKCVFARGEVFENKYTIVVVVCGIVILIFEHALYVVVAVGLDDIATGIAQYYFGSVDRSVLVISFGIVGIE